MTRLGDNMEKQARLLSSKLFQKHRQVEVVLNRSVLAWKETEKSEKRSSGISSALETGECSMETWMSFMALLWCSSKKAFISFLEIYAKQHNSSHKNRIVNI